MRAKRQPCVDDGAKLPIRHFTFQYSGQQRMRHGIEKGCDVGVDRPAPTGVDALSGARQSVVYATSRSICIGICMEGAFRERLQCLHGEALSEFVTQIIDRKYPFATIRFVDHELSHRYRVVMPCLQFAGKTQQVQWQVVAQRVGIDSGRPGRLVIAQMSPGPIHVLRGDHFRNQVSHGCISGSVERKRRTAVRAAPASDAVGGPA